MITPETLDLQIDRNLDGSFVWYTSSCRRLAHYEPHACVKASAMSDKKGRFNLLTVIPPEHADDVDVIIALIRKAALLNANFPDLINQEFDAGTMGALVDEAKRGGVVH